MTYEEAIVIIRHLWCSEHIDYSDEEVREALDIAKKAIEKQIPKKPIHITRNEHSTKIIGYGCPACHKDIIGSGFYCWSCGQATNWSDER